MRRRDEENGPGSVALRRALDSHKWTQTELEERLKVTSGTVSRWLSGDRIPDVSNAVALQSLLGVPVEVWAKAKQDKRAAS